MGEVLGVSGIEVLAWVLVIAVPLFGVWLARKLGARFNLHMSIAQEQRLQDVLIKAVAWAEEKALAAVKSGQPKPASAQKLEAALAYAMGEVKRLKLDVLAEEKLRQLLESALNLTRTVPGLTLSTPAAEPAELPAPAPAAEPAAVPAADPKPTV